MHALTGVGLIGRATSRRCAVDVPSAMTRSVQVVKDGNAETCTNTRNVDATTCGLRNNHSTAKRDPSTSPCLCVRSARCSLVNADMRTSFSSGMTTQEIESEIAQSARFGINDRSAPPIIFGPTFISKTISKTVFNIIFECRPSL